MTLPSHPTVEQLRTLSSLQELDDDQLKRIAGSALLLRKTEREPLLTHGSDVIGLYILLEGSVSVFLPHAKQAIFQLNAPTFLGEMAFLDAKPASATVRVASPTLTFMVISRERLRELCMVDPLIGLYLYRNLAKLLASRLREANLAMSRIL